MRLRIAHSTSYRYEPPATGVIQILRMTPGSHDGQYVAEWQIDVSTDSRLQMHQDAFGNVTHVLTEGPIDDLTITVDGLIETHDTGGVLRGTDERFPPSLFLRSTPLTVVNPAMATFGARIARGIRRRRARLPACADDADQRAHDVRRRPDQQRHLGRRGLRAEARRVPGLRAYLHRLRAHRRRAGALRRRAFPALRRHGPRSRPATPGRKRIVPDLGWVGFDPANGICTTDAHARVAIGLDYLGAAPVRGTRYGGGTETLSVAVKVEQAGGRQSQSQS